MSKIEQLIKEKCPNGVEYKTLKDICDFKRGQSRTLKTLKNGNYPVVAGGQTPSFYCDIYNRDYECITVSSSGAYAGCLNYWNNKILCTDSFSITSKDKNLINNKFLFQYLKKNQDWIYSRKKGAGIPHIHISDVDKIKIPCPPIEVQEEIVKILDKFSKLEAELEAELEARKKQYEFWHTKLLNVSDRTQFVTFGDVATIVRGASPRPIKDFITTNDDGIPWVKIGDTNLKTKYITSTKESITKEGSKKSRIVNEGDFLLSNSMSFGRPYISKIKGCIHDGWLSISNYEKTFLPDFLYYLLSSKKVQQIMNSKASNGTVKNLNADIVKSIRLPIYSKQEQERIVKILDKFDKLINDISEGIPAEIEARRKQYEYYRNKLLSFEELKVND